MSVLAQASVTADPFRFVWHPEVWLLVSFLIGAYVYMVRVIGPYAVPSDQRPVSHRQWCWFVAAILMLWAASDWPIHDVGEQYLYSVHMLQHMMLSYFLPPLVLMATPEWLLRTLIGNGRLYSAVQWLCRPIAAGIIFNLAVMVTHVPGVVNASVESGAVHYGLHVLVVTTSLLMWMPVVGPFPEFRLGPAGTTIYLFLQSVVPTVPAGWLVFAEGTVYKHYGEQPVRVRGISPTDDQQIAGAIMKVGGSMFLWTIVVYVFFTKLASSYGKSQDYRRGVQMPTAEITGHDEAPLTTADVEREFARVPATPEPD